MQQRAHVRAQALGRALVPDAVSRELLAPGAFVGLILASNYALAALPNVKLFDLLVFVGGYALGLRRGITVAAVAWLIYGNVNPWGVAHPQLLVVLIASEALFATAGAGIRRVVPPHRIPLRPTPAMLAFLLPAIIVTPLYDVLTNVYTGYFWAAVAGSTDYARWITLALFNQGALFFMAVHAGANAAFFPVFGPLLVKAAAAAKGGRRCR